MNLVRWAGLLTFLLLFLYPFSVNAIPTIDPAKQFDRNFVLDMEILVGEEALQESPSIVLHSDGWLAVSEVEELLKAPRQKTVIWLRARVHNTSEEPLQPWLELSPWRLNRIDAWLLDTLTGQVKGHVETGLNQPLSARRVASNRAVIPISLASNKSVDLLVRIESESRPYLSIKSWDPISFMTDQAERYQFHTILLAVTLTLAVVLLLHANVRYMLVCCWMLSLFVFEAEKEAYISYLLFDDLADYASNIRFSFSVIAKSLFMVVSVYLLGLNRHWFWRWILPLSVLISLFYTGLTFLIDNNLLRQVAMVFHVGCSLVWPLIVPAALSKKRGLQKTILTLLSVVWLTNSVYVFSYTLNINYTSEMATIRLLIEVSFVLILLLVYALQKRHYELSLERQLHQTEQNERKRLEQAVTERTQELNLALDMAQKADAAKTKFLSRVTHDLKSPLTSIMGYAQLLSAEFGKVGQKGQIIYSSANHMLNLVNRLVDYARDVTTLEVVESDLYLHAFINSVAYEGRVMASKRNNRLILDIDPQLPLVIRCDETLLREVMLNLLENAAKYTTDGCIGLRVRSRLMPSKAPQSLELSCEVEDSGCGIDPKLQNQLFDPFFRGADQGEGAGLGLSIVKELVERVGGQVCLNSTLGEGTHIAFTIPVCLGHESADFALLKAPGQMLPEYNANGLKAWVVEDAQPIRDLLEVELRQLRFQVRTFSDAETAMAALQTTVTLPDIILTDHRLPKASGDRVLEAARARKPDLPVLLLSATWYLQQGNKTDSLPSYTALLGKPVNLAHMRREVAKACGLHALPCENVATASGADPSISVALDAASIKQLEYWLELGAVTDIVEWCEQLGQQPQYVTWAEELSALAERGDFRAIQQRLTAVKFI